MAYRGAPIIDSQGEQTDPTTSTVMADTGAVTVSGFYDVLVVLNTTANAQFQLQHRNTANGGNVSDVCGAYCAANAPAEIKGVFYLNNGERLRVMMDANLTGSAWVTIFALRVQ